MRRALNSVGIGEEAQVIRCGGHVTATTLQTEVSQRARWQVIVAASIGNALEWFDLVVFGFFAIVISKLFFPSTDPFSSLLSTWLAFAFPYLARPLGAIFFGIYADKFGRKSALTLSITLMMLGTLMIAVAPTHASIGVLASVIIVVARIFQGFSAGGEFGSATAFLAEQNPARRGFFASWQFASQAVTTILGSGFAAGLTAFVSPAQLEAGWWRLPFVFGLLIGPVALYIRTRLDETPEFKLAGPATAPLREAISIAKTRLLIGAGLVVLSTAATYEMTIFMPVFAVKQLGLRPDAAYFAGFVMGLIQLALIPWLGSLSDRIGRITLPLIGAGALFVCGYPLWVWLTVTPTLQTLLILQAIAGVLIALYIAPLPALLSELFPTKIRTTGLSLTYSFAVMIFGGFAPTVNELLVNVTGSKVAPSFYLMFAAGMSLLALFGARRLGHR
jgi:MHS family proline/betaine transporter-like MFS transporter